MGAILSQSHIGPWLTTIHVKAHAKKVTINAINDWCALKWMKNDYLFYSCLKYK